MTAEKAVEKVRRRRGRKNGDKVEERQKSKTQRHETSAEKGHRSLLIQFTDEAQTWFECGKNTPGRDATIFTDPPSPSDPKNKDLVSKYRARADELYRVELQIFNASHGQQSSSDERWVENTMRRGTLKDRIAAMSVVASTNPVHKLYALDGLLQMAGCSETGGLTNARMAQMAAEALEDLFLNTFLPKRRKLVSLEHRPLYRYESKDKRTLSPRVLLLWRYEEMIKEKYQAFLRNYLSQTLRDGMEISKMYALRLAGSLLRAAPEAEDQILSMMVNKLGDPAKKTAALAGHELRRVLGEHANMQVVIAREVQQLAHRPHLSPRALYNCITFLNQLQLEQEDDVETEEPEKAAATKKGISQPFSLPASLINTYFRLFEIAVSDKGKDDTDGSAGMKSRLLSALLTGVNRAHPYLPEADKDMDSHIDSLFRVVHAAAPAASTQALMLLFHVICGSKRETKPSTKSQPKQDRFYRALYSTLSSSTMMSSGKHLTLFFNLLYKAMKYDRDVTRVNAFAKRLLCTTMHSAPPVVAACLFLLNEIMKFHPQLKDCFIKETEGSNALVVLDATKREPMAALVRFPNGSLNHTSDDPSVTTAAASLWETTLLAHHFHPSVAKFADTLSAISYTGDPLRDFSLTPFLDKFAYRNPKTGKRGGDLHKASVAARRQNQAENDLPVNDPSFLEKQDIDEQEEFFHKFFVERARRDEIKGIVRGKKDDMDEDEALDIAENTELDHDTLEEGWDTDPEEEAFVDSLAQKLIDDAAVNDEADLDDEDPDMEGWDDLYSDEEGAGDEQDDVGKEANEEDESDSDEIGAEEGEEEDGDGDAFMDEESSDEEGALDPELDEECSDAGGEDDLALLQESDYEEEEESGEKDTQTAQSKKDTLSQTFVDASEYEDIINKSWRERKRPGETLHMDDARPDDDHSAPKGKKKHKNKYKRRKG